MSADVATREGPVLDRLREFHKHLAYRRFIELLPQRHPAPRSRPGADRRPELAGSVLPPGVG